MPDRIVSSVDCCLSVVCGQWTSSLRLFIMSHGINLVKYCSLQNWFCHSVEHPTINTFIKGTIFMYHFN